MYESVLCLITNRTCVSSVSDSLNAADVRHQADDVTRLVTGQTLDFTPDGWNQSESEKKQQRM